MTVYLFIMYKREFHIFLDERPDAWRYLILDDSNHKIFQDKDRYKLKIWLKLNNLRFSERIHSHNKRDGKIFFDMREYVLKEKNDV